MAEVTPLVLARKKALSRAETAVKSFPPLLKREFELTRYAEKAKKGCLFRVLQWNVLADALSTSSPMSNFIRCPPEALEWSNRQHRVLQGIISFQPHIICLEEVDHFKDFFKPTLEGVGYQGIFNPKADSPCLKFPGNSGPDGTAIFFDQERYTMIEHLEMTLEGPAGPTSQVCIIVKLFDKITKKPLFCCVTHLKAKPEFEEIRFAQGKSILMALKNFMGDDKAEVVICGDFNAEATEHVYQIMGDGIHFAPLKSAYKSGNGSEPEFTTWKVRPSGEVKHTIDYVWHSEGLQIAGYLKVPFDDEMTAGRIPCMEYPSDHISLVFDMFWT